MQIGILQCDKVRSSLSAEFGEYPAMFEKGFEQIEGGETPFTFVTYRAHAGEFPEDVSECDAYLITGSRYSVLDDAPWINQLQNFIIRLNKSNVKTIGVCFGHQAMAVALGGKVERADCGWQIGAHNTEVIQPQAFMQPKASHFYIAMFCQDQVVSIGDDAIVLAKSDGCEFAMLQYGEHMLSVQGHPEFNQAFAKASLNLRQEDFPRKRFDDGMASFSQQGLDTELLFTWFRHFIVDGATDNPRTEDNEDK